MGYTQPSRKRTVLGTAGHKTLQILAERKLKDNQDIIDDEIGVVGVDASVDDIVEQSFNYYTSHNTHIEFVDKDLRDLKKWVNSIITSHNGKFDPRNQNVVACELPFVIEFKEDWAKYKYSFRGEEIEGYLKLKGTIDLVVSHGDGVYEIVDYKFGARKNWATGEEKTLEKLRDDIQLRLYHYAIYKLFEDARSVMSSIYYVMDGGVFTVCFDKTQNDETEKIIREKFEYVRDMKKPDMLDPRQRVFQCTKICRFYKDKFDGTSNNMCKQIHQDIDKYGIDFVTEKYAVDGFDPSFYRAPGSV